MQMMIYGLCSIILSRTVKSIYFGDAIRKIIQILTCHYYIIIMSASRRLNLRACWSAAGVFLCFAGGKATLSGYSRRATLPAG